MTTAEFEKLKKLKALSAKWIKLKQKQKAALAKEGKETMSKTELSIKKVYLYAREAVSKKEEQLAQQKQMPVEQPKDAADTFDFSEDIELPEGFLFELRQLEGNFEHLEQQFMSRVSSSEDKKAGMLRQSQKVALLSKTDELTATVEKLKASYQDTTASTQATCDTHLQPTIDRIENLKSRIIGTALYSHTAGVKLLEKKTPKGESYGPGSKRKKLDPNSENSAVRESNKQASTAVTTSFVFNTEKIAAAIGGGVTLSWSEKMTFPTPVAGLKVTAGFGLNFTASVEASASADWAEERIGANLKASLSLGGSLSLGVILGDLVECTLTPSLKGNLVLESKAYMDAAGNYEVMLFGLTGGITGALSYSIGPSPVVQDILKLVDCDSVSLSYTDKIGSASLLKIGPKTKKWRKGFWKLSEMDISAGDDLKNILNFASEKVNEIEKFYNNFVNGIKNVIEIAGKFTDYCVKELNTNIKEYSHNLKGFAVFLVTGEYQDAHEWRAERMRMRKDMQKIHEQKCLELFSAVVETAKETALRNPKIILELAKVDKDKRVEQLAKICLNDAAVIAASDALFNNKDLREGFLIGRALKATISAFDIRAEPIAGNNEIQLGQPFNAILVMSTDIPFHAPSIAVELRCNGKVVGSNNYSGLIKDSLRVQGELEFNIPSTYPDSSTAKWTLYAKFNQTGELQDREIEKEIKVTSNPENGNPNEDAAKYKDLTPLIKVHSPQVESYQGNLPLFAGMTLDVDLTIDLPETIEDAVLNISLSNASKHSLAKAEIKGVLLAGKGIKRTIKLELPSEKMVKEQQIHGGEYTLSASINRAKDTWIPIAIDNQLVQFYKGY